LGDPCSYSLIQGLTTNLDRSNLTNYGVLNWTNTSTLPARSFTNIIRATDNFTTLSATNSFVIIVLTNVPMPVITVPASRTIYVGLPLDVFVFVTNSAFPNDSYSFKTNATTPPGVVLVPGTNSAEVKWTPTSAQTSKGYTISILATETNHPGLSVVGSFSVNASAVAYQPATFTASPTPSGTNVFRFTLNTQPNLTWRIDASTNLFNWQPLFTNQSGNSSTLQFTDLLTTNFTLRFYRGVLQ
jgi:hypothetical protein